MAREQLATQLELAHYRTSRDQAEPLMSESIELASYEFFFEALDIFRLIC